MIAKKIWTEWKEMSEKVIRKKKGCRRRRKKPSSDEKKGNPTDTYTEMKRATCSNWCPELTLFSFSSCAIYFLFLISLVPAGAAA